LSTSETALTAPVLDATATLAPDRNPVLVYLSSLSEGSKPTMRGTLNELARIATSGKCQTAEACPFHLMRYSHTQAIRAQLVERYAPATTNKFLACLRGVLKEAWRLELISAEELARACDLKAVKQTKLPAGRAITSGELRTLFEACTARTPSSARDAGLVALLYGAGIRRSEATALDLDDYDQETGELTIRGGKGRKDRTCYATNGAADAINAWLAVRGDTPGPLFLPVLRGGRIINRRLSSQSVLDILNRIGKRAGVRKFTAHDFRRSFISDLLDAGQDISVTASLVGHSSVNTTARYDRRGEVGKRKAVTVLHVPFIKVG